MREDEIMDHLKKAPSEIVIDVERFFRDIDCFRFIIPF
jgi:hypothetical protein